MKVKATLTKLMAPEDLKQEMRKLGVDQIEGEVIGDPKQEYIQVNFYTYGQHKIYRDSVTLTLDTTDNKQLYSGYFLIIIDIINGL